VSLRDRILASDDIGKQIIIVPHWDDVELEIRTMTAAERATMLNSAIGPDGEMDLQELYPRILIGTIFDPETGDAVFTHDDVNALKNKSASAVEFVAQKSMALSGLTGEAVDAEGKAS
jgi:hypothetical protein